MMQSFLAAALLAVGSLSPIASAFNASAIDTTTKTGWCKDQISQCPNICHDLGKNTVTNTCFPDNLFYQCICSDNITPNTTQYSQTIPYFECTVDQTDCVAACGSDNDCSNQCRKDNACGASDPTRVNVTAVASSTTASSTANPTSTSTDGDDSSSAGSIVHQSGNVYGVGILAAGIAVGAAFVGL